MNPRLVGLVPFALSAALLLAAPLAAARGAEPDGAAPYLEIDGRPVAAARMPLVANFAEVDLRGDVAEVTLTQVYENLHATPIEAVYVFPGSTRAAITGLSMTLGDRVITAKVHERQEAREVYEAAKDAGKTATLLEMLRPNALRMNVANILPGELIQVEIVYVERVRSAEGVYELVLPAVVGERYAGPDAGLDPSAAPSEPGPTDEVPFHPPGMPWGVMRGVSIDLAAGVPIREVLSPSHPIAPLEAPARFYHHGHTELAAPPRDFVLRYRLGADAVSTGVLLYAGEDGEQYFMATLAPPARVVASEVLAREYVFLLDTSGSMGGWPLETAKSLLTELLAGMRPTDRFNVVTFAGDADLLSPTSLTATPANVRGLAARIDGLGGGGGTQLLNALQTALALPTTPGLTRTFVVVTDGYVSVEAQAFRLIREHLGDANVFAFGIGGSCNRHLIEQLAAAGRGEPTVVMDEEAAWDEAQRFRAAIEAPILTDLAVRFEGLDAYDVAPAIAPDLFAERPLVVIGKYRGAATGELVVTGRGAAGPFEARVDVGALQADPANAVIATFWARERVDLLSEAEALGQDTKAEIVAIGLAHHLLTRYTSFVAVDERVRAQGAPERVVQPVPGGVEEDEAEEGAFGGGIGVAVSGGGVDKLSVRAAGLQGLFSGGPGGPASAGIGGMGFTGTGTGGSGQGVGRIHGLGAIDAGGGVGDGKKAKALAVRLAVRLDHVVGAVAEAQIKGVVLRRLAALRACYERALTSQPELAGRLVLHLTVDAGGGAAKIAVVTAFAPAVDACVVGQLSRARFPRPSDGKVAATHLTLEFAPAP